MKITQSKSWRSVAFDPIDANQTARIFSSSFSLLLLLLHPSPSPFFPSHYLKKKNLLPPKDSLPGGNLAGVTATPKNTCIKNYKKKEKRGKKIFWARKEIFVNAVHARALMRHQVRDVLGLPLLTRNTASAAAWRLHLLFSVYIPPLLSSCFPLLVSFIFPGFSSLFWTPSLLSKIHYPLSFINLFLPNSIFTLPDF